MEMEEWLLQIIKFILKKFNVEKIWYEKIILF